MNGKANAIGIAPAMILAGRIQGVVEPVASVALARADRSEKIVPFAEPRLRLVVRVIARDPGRLPEEIREQVEVVRGSTNDAATLRRALDGVEALFWCVPGESLQETNLRGHYERFARAGCLAIREAGTPRVVTISAGGKGRARNAGPIPGLHAMEDILNQSGAVIRHLRCASFMEDFLREAQPICEHRILSYPMPGHIAIPMAAADDSADVAL